MSYDLSLIIPTIRPHLLDDLYKSIEQSCNRHSWELVLCGPYKPSDELLKKENVLFIEDWGSPSRASQIAAYWASGKYLYHCTDDLKFYPNEISNGLDLADETTIVCMKYTEYFDYQFIEMPSDYWVLRGLPCYKGPEFEQINQDWGCFCQFIVARHLFIDYGGFDAETFEYLNHVCHDFLFRVQRNGIKTVESKNYICNARWIQADNEDHSPVFRSQMFSDLPKFNAMWGTPNDRKIIDYDNYERAEEKWSRRFGA